MQVSVITVVSVAGALAVLLAYARFVEPRWLRVRRRVVELPRWPGALDGLTILHLSDAHIGGRPSPADEFLRRARSLDADLLVFTGDLIANPAGLERACAAMRSFARGRTVYAVPGNHEYSHYGFRLPGQRWQVKRRLDEGRIFRALEEAGLTMLVNRSVTVERSSARLTLAGIGDIFHDAHDLDAALAGATADAPVVLLGHSPDVADEAAKRGVALVLCGHTHGGQVRLPLLGAPTTGTLRPMEHGMPSGVIRRGETVMHVSPGLGLTWLPFRLFARPEITVLELRGR